MTAIDKKLNGNRSPVSLANLTGRGRPKGVRNKRTVSALNAIAEAAEIIGGADRLAAWAQESPENERIFWSTIYPKLLPLQVTGANGGAIQTERRDFIDPSTLSVEQRHQLRAIMVAALKLQRNAPQCAIEANYTDLSE